MTIIYLRQLEKAVTCEWYVDMLINFGEINMYSSKYSNKIEIVKNRIVEPMCLGFSVIRSSVSQFLNIGRKNVFGTFKIL